MRKDILIIAHRGASRYAPENTIPAFKLAERMGAHFIELDVHMTKDGEIIVLHPFFIKNMRVKELTLNQIRSIDVGVRFSYRYKNTHIPTLNEAIESVNLGINIEIKGGEKVYPGILDRIIEIVRDYPINRFIFSSFDIDTLRTLKKKREDAFVEGLYFLPDLKNIPDFLSGINPYFAFVNRRMVEKVHSKGFAIKPYTVNALLLMKRLISTGVDGIFTDTPDILRKLL